MARINEILRVTGPSGQSYTVHLSLDTTEKTAKATTEPAASNEDDINFIGEQIADCIHRVSGKPVCVDALFAPEPLAKQLKTEFFEKLGIGNLRTRDDIITQVRFLRDVKAKFGASDDPRYVNGVIHALEWVLQPESEGTPLAQWADELHRMVTQQAEEQEEFRQIQEKLRNASRPN